MIKTIPPLTLDAIIDALSEGDKAAALLYYYRASGSEDLEGAKTAVDQLLLDLGDNPDDLPQKPDDDDAYRAVSYYLEDPAKRRRDTLFMFPFIIVALGVAAFFLIRHAPTFTTSIRSFLWPKADATILHVHLYTQTIRSGSRTDPYTNIDVMDFVFQYEVEGQEYVDERTEVHYIEELGQTPFAIKDQFQIPYNPRDPSQTVYEKRLFFYGIRVFIGLIALGVALLIAAAGISLEYGRWRLRQLDEKSVTSAG
ncbi:MAG: DUF3592 domain-containing protein [Chloroflexota bacterium]